MVICTIKRIIYVKHLKIKKVLNNTVYYLK